MNENQFGYPSKTYPTKETGIRHKFDTPNQRANEAHPGICLKLEIDAPVTMATATASSFALEHWHLSGFEWLPPGI